MDSLLPNYVQGESLEGRVAVAEMYKAIRNDDIEFALRQLHNFSY